MSTPDPAEQTMIRNIEEKFGKPFDTWVNIVNKSGLHKHGEIVKFLKTEHGFTHGYANMVAMKAKKRDAGSMDNDDLVSGQYAGEKSELKPIYDELVKHINKFGSDIELAPKKAYVSIRRNKQFAVIQPSTKARVDLGLNIKGKEPEGRLELSGSFNAMVSHRVKLTGTKDIDKEIISWLKEAYDKA